MALFQVAVNATELPIGVRQMASILCKNSVETRWGTHLKDVTPLPEDEKAFLREHILDSLTSTPRDVRCVFV